MPVKTKKQQQNPQSHLIGGEHQMFCEWPLDQEFGTTSLEYFSKLVAFRVYFFISIFLIKLSFRLCPWC